MVSLRVPLWVLKVVREVLYRAYVTALRMRLAFVRGRVRYDWVLNRYELVKPMGAHLYVVRTWKEPRRRRRKGKRP